MASVVAVQKLEMGRPSARRSAALWAAVVLCTALSATGLTWRGARANEALRLQTNFEVRVRDAEERIATRMAAYEQVLRGAAALFVASEGVERAEFHDYVAATRIEEHYPGIQGVGFALVVPVADLARHVSEQQASIPGYQVRPSGPREFYTSIVFLEPFSGRNLRAVGYDMYSEPVRREAMERARDEGRAVLSGKVRLVQETDEAVQAGVLMYLPVYRNGPAPRDPAERRDRLLGWAYLPFRMDDLMNGTLGERGSELSTRLYDGDALTPEGLLYDSTASVGLFDDERYQAQRTLLIAEHPWTMLLRAGPQFGAQLGRRPSGFIALGGACLSLLLSALVWVLIGGKARAEQVARDMNRDLLQAHADLQVSERRFRKMADGAPVLIWTSGTDKLCSWLNRPWLEFTGRTLAQELGNGWAEGVHPDDLSRCLATYVGAFDRREPFTMEYRLRRHDAAWRWVLDSGSPHFDEGGTFIGYIGSCIDITGHRDAEAQLQDSELRLRLALRGGELALWDWDLPSGRLIFNERWAEMLGFTLAELTPHLSTWERRLHPDDAAPVRASLEAHLRGETAAFSAEYRFRHKDGHWVWILDAGVVVQRAPDGTPLRAAGTHLDISERKRAEEERKELLARSSRAERSAALGTLAAGMAHEINNPLAAVLSGVGFAQTQLQGFGHESLRDVHEALADAAEGTLRVRDLVADLQSIASGNQTDEAQCELVNALARAARMSGYAHTEATTLTIELPPLPPVNGSEAELAQLFGCLLVNAAQAGGLEPNTVHVTAELRGLVVAVKISDTGAGIAAEILPRIFDPFFTTRRPGRGKGLGLPVAQGIARGLGGSVEVHSEAGRGTTATVVLPLAPPLSPG